MNYERNLNSGHIPQGMQEVANQPNAYGNMEIGNDNILENFLMEMMRRMEMLEKKLESVRVGQQQTPQEMSESQIPAFLKGQFSKDYKQKPAEAMINLLADIHGRQAESGQSLANPKNGLMDMVLKLSKQVRKDRLFEKHDDAAELIEDIEAVFNEFPELKNRPDAYEVAYKMVKGNVLGEQDAENEIVSNKTGKKSDWNYGKENAFVEGSVSASPSRAIIELTPVQREICKKMGISEKSFKKYMKRNEE